MIGIEDNSGAAGPALLNLGFRPFFSGAVLYSFVAMLMWMALTVFGRQWPFAGPAPGVWHAHEMIYGYGMAVVAGFLLTAVKNWTGIQTLHRTPLLLLFLLWLAGRVLVFFGEAIPLEVTALVDCLFTVLLVIAVSLPIVKLKQWEQSGILSKLVLLFASNLLFYAGALGLVSGGVRAGLYSGIYLLIALIFAMGRRVMPFFIEKGVGYEVRLKNRKWLDISSLVVFLVFWLGDILDPDSLLVALSAGGLFILHSIRLADWHTPGIWRKPLLWVLFIGYGSIIIGFALKLAVYIFGISPFLALHAFAVGGIGMTTLGMMARVTLGHTGRNVFEPPALVNWIFAAIFGGTIFRVLVPLLDPGHYLLWIGVSQAFWIGAFSLFIIVFLPMLVQPRVDGRYG
ncbi:MAG: NnrS family protein [Gammaproteobacteria bacterium]|nr:NnrS family protein [Gammaproteobacteria bacterium]MDH3559652.1 NnrS family protein [Gammaproteobacteria bacterium]